MSGRPKAAVLPEPVRALTSTFFPSNNKGIAASCIKVGSSHPKLEIDYKIFIVVSEKLMFAFGIKAFTFNILSSNSIS